MDGSYGQPARLSPYSAPPQAPSTNNYQVNIKRNKTRKWVEAKTHNYDGDDWGADEFDDDDDDDDEHEHEHEHDEQSQRPSEPQAAVPKPLYSSSQSHEQQRQQPLEQQNQQPQQQQQQQQQEYTDSSPRRASASPTTGLSDLPSLRALPSEVLSPVAAASDSAFRSPTEQAAASPPFGSSDFGGGVQLTEDPRPPQPTSLPPGTQPASGEHRLSSPVFPQKLDSPVIEAASADADEDESAHATGGASLTDTDSGPTSLYPPRGFSSIPPLRTPSPYQSRDNATPILLSTNPHFTPTESSKRSESPALFQGEPASSTEGSSPVKESDRLSDEIMKTLRPRGATLDGLSLMDNAHEPALAGDKERSQSIGGLGQWEDAMAGSQAQARRSPSPLKASYTEPIGEGGFQAAGGRGSVSSNILRRKFSWEAPDEQEAATLQTTGPPPPQTAAQGHSSTSTTLVAAGGHPPAAASPAATVSALESDGQSPTSPMSQMHQVSPQESFERQAGVPLPAAAEGPSVSHSPLAVLSPTGHSLAAKIMSFRDILALGSSTDRAAKFDETRRMLAAQESGLASWLSYCTTARSDPGANASSALGPSQDSPGAPLASPATNQQPYYQQYLGSNVANPPSASAGRARLGGLSIPTQMSGSAFSHSSAQIGTKGKEFMHSAGKMGKGLLSKGKSKLRGSGDKGETLLQAAQQTPRPRTGERRTPWRLSIGSLDPKSRDGTSASASQGSQTQTDKQEAVDPGPTLPPVLPVQSPVSPFDAGLAMDMGMELRQPSAAKLQALNLPTANSPAEPSLSEPLRIPVPAPAVDVQGQSLDRLQRVSSFVGLPPIRVGSALALSSPAQSATEYLHRDAGGWETADRDDLTVNPPTPSPEYLRRTTPGQIQKGVLKLEVPQQANHEEHDAGYANRVLPYLRSLPQPTPTTKQAAKPSPTPVRTPTGPRKLKQIRPSETPHTLSRKRSDADLSQQAMADGYSRELGFRPPARPTALVSPVHAMPQRQRSDMPPSSAQRYPELFAPHPHPRPGARPNMHNAGQSTSRVGRDEAVTGAGAGASAGAGEAPPDQPEERGRRRSSNVFKEIGSRIKRAASRERRSRSRPATANAQPGEAPTFESGGGHGEVEDGKKRQSLFGLSGRRASFEKASPQQSQNDFTARSSSIGPRGDQKSIASAASHGKSSSYSVMRSGTAGDFPEYYDYDDEARSDEREPRRKESAITNFFSRSRGRERHSNSVSSGTPNRTEESRPRTRSNTMGSWTSSGNPNFQRQSSTSKPRTPRLAAGQAGQAGQVRQSQESTYLLPEPQFGGPIVVPAHMQQQGGRSEWSRSIGIGKGHQHQCNAENEADEMETEIESASTPCLTLGVSATSERSLEDRMMTKMPSTATWPQITPSTVAGDFSIHGGKPSGLRARSVASQLEAPGSGLGSGSRWKGIRSRLAGMGPFRSGTRQDDSPGPANGREAPPHFGFEIKLRSMTTPQYEYEPVPIPDGYPRVHGPRGLGGGELMSSYGYSVQVSGSRDLRRRWED